MNVIILGGGIAGISAGYHLKKRCINNIIFEKDPDWGGLCGNFTIDGFRFDRFVHFSFAPDESDQRLFAGNIGMYEHTPFPSNYYRGYWLRHPAQNNLAPLTVDEKVKIIADFVTRPQKDVSEINNYDEWLRVQYGNYFAENFPFAYTRKYWGLEAKELETKWVGIRMYTPDIKQVLAGSFQTQEECFYFAKKMFYPKKGGFKSILNDCREGLDIRLNKKVIEINPSSKTIKFSDDTIAEYDRLISTLPLPEIIKMLPNVTENVLKAARDLRYTCGYQISLGFNRPDIAKYLWFYIYDEDILSSRVYSPNLKSPDNVPEGCSSLQAEVFFDNKAQRPSADIVLQNTINKLIEMKIFDENDLIVKDIRFEPYANVTFVPSIYENRKIILDYLDTLGITSIGRFGKWEYAWTHQAFADGKDL
ncbi:FAD-dependent oxidoreductase [Orbus wheelerorum]|uniref:protoporphyrinogen/coproporphyrinogen oxidase n=1 Tax=Orbus wheelerorum TaxID=3074111 RepID=UPI00370D5457